MEDSLNASGRKLLPLPVAVSAAPKLASADAARVDPALRISRPPGGLRERGARGRPSADAAAWHWHMVVSG